MTKPRVAVIGCGGTISSISTHALDVLDYTEFGRKMSVGEALAMVPEIGQFVEPALVPYREVGSSAIGPQDWLHLAETIARMIAQDEGIAGFVILHGTATIEETAFFLNLVLKTDKPVVLVGAQRPMNALSSDAPMNLVGAMRTAIHPDARGKGVLVTLNDEIHAARDVTKTSTYRLQTFRSPDFGLLGHIDGDAVRFYREPLRKHTLATPFHLDAVRDLPRVDIVYAYAGADEVAIKAFRAAGARGLVSGAFAPGLPTPAQKRALEIAAAEGVVVVQASRAGSGRVARRRYLLEKGMVGSDNLPPHKARILLMLALTITNDPDAIQEMFETY
ncbi:MAG: asparaginase [Salinarimonadaceae bacterium]|nr:MAG: asparaginase [Salinarimonadaceae bacterium]